MKAIDQATIVFTSRSANEGFVRAAAACFAAQLDPTLDEVADIKTAGRGRRGRWRWSPPHSLPS